MGASTGSKFKVGDMVRTTNPEAPWNGVGTIITKGNFCWIVDFDGVEGGFYADQLVAAAPQQQLRIEAGKFYKTRDGRKVGPMEVTTEGYTAKERVDGIQRLWQGDGAHGGIYVENEARLDLIAEWPAYASNPAAEVDNLRDEYGPVGTAANDNSTAGFTVPLDAYDVPPVAESTSGKEELRLTVTADFTDFHAALDEAFDRLREFKRKAKKLGIDLAA